jgi:phosphonate transport system substrate-binding protein
VGQSYSAVVEAMVGDQVDIAWFGPVTYHQAKERGCAELLAVAVSKGESVYYSGIFCSADSEMETIQDLKGKRVAFGDVNSTSSYNYPVAMLIEAGVDPVTDLAEVHMTGSHANSLQALASGAVDAACAAFDSFAKAVEAGNIDPDKIKVLVKSDPIPYPPLAMHVKLDSEVQAKLREAFNTVHEDPGIAPEMIRGYGGKQVDQYRADFPPEEFDRAMARIAVVTDDVNAAMLEKAAER